MRLFYDQKHNYLFNECPERDIIYITTDFVRSCANVASLRLFSAKKV